MVCRRCNTEIGNAPYCTVCGTPAETQPAYQPAYQQPAYQQPGYQQPEYQQPQTIIQNNNIVQQEETAPITSIGSYIGWSLIPSIPLIGLILVIVFACDGKNKNRANYFRALLIMSLIASVLILVPFFIFGGAIMNELQYMMY